MSNDLDTIIDSLSRMAAESRAWKDIAQRGQEARGYALAFLGPKSLGTNMWHAILDDAIALRKAHADDTKY